METKHVNKHDGTTPQKPCAPPNSMTQDTARICGMLGLCVKAGKAVLGAPLVLQAIRSMQSATTTADGVSLQRCICEYL